MESTGSSVRVGTVSSGSLPPHPTLPCHHKGILVRYPRKARAKGLRHRMRHRMPLTPRVCGESTGCASGLEVEVGAASPRRPGDNPL